MEIKITAIQIVDVPLLRVFVDTFKTTCHPNADVYIVDVPDTITMADIWDRFDDRQKMFICGALSNDEKYKHIHIGMLALVKVTSVFLALKNSLFNVFGLNQRSSYRWAHTDHKWHIS